MRTRLGVLLAGAMAIGGERPSCVGGGEVYGGPPVGFDAGLRPPAPVYGGPPPMPDAAPPEELDASAMLDASSTDVRGDASVAKS